MLGRLPLTLIALLVLAACATPYGAARTALVQGRYEEAASRFEEILAGDPNRLDALVGLGQVRYKLGAYDEAIGLLTRAALQAPQSEAARLYLALSHLQKNEIPQAVEHLRAFRGLNIHPRIAAQVDRALALLGKAPVSADVRVFIAASLEDEAEWAREVRERELAARYAPPPFYGVPYGPGPCFVTRFGHLVCY